MPSLICSLSYLSVWTCSLSLRGRKHLRQCDTHPCPIVGPRKTPDAITSPETSRLQNERDSPVRDGPVPQAMGVGDRCICRVEAVVPIVTGPPQS